MTTNIIQYSWQPGYSNFIVNCTYILGHGEMNVWKYIRDPVPHQNMDFMSADDELSWRGSDRPPVPYSRLHPTYAHHRLSLAQPFPSRLGASSPFGKVDADILIAESIPNVSQPVKRLLRICHASWDDHLVVRPEACPHLTCNCETSPRSVHSYTYRR